MLKNYRRGLLFIICVIMGCFLIYACMSTDGFGLASGYKSGKTIEKALDFCYERETSKGEVSKILSIEDIGPNHKLVFYKSNYNTLGAAMLEQKWNNRWTVIDYGVSVSLDNKEPNLTSTGKALGFALWRNLNRFTINVGVVYDPNIKTVTVAGKDVKILDQNSIRYYYCFTNEKVPTDSYVDPSSDVKAYDKKRKLVYSYYPQ